MKKIILLSALALGAMTMSAQIELELTINSKPTAYIYCEDYQNFDCGKMAFAVGDSVLTLYNDDMTFYKKVTLPSYSRSVSPRDSKKNPSAVMGGPSCGIYCVSKNIFTTDGKIAFVRMTSNFELAVYNEDGTLIKDFGEKDDSFGILQVNGKYKFIIKMSDWDSQTYATTYTTEVYALPGKGTPTDLESPTTPARTSNARKVVENGQMYIILDGVKYAVTGSQAE